LAPEGVREFSEAKVLKITIPGVLAMEGKKGFG